MGDLVAEVAPCTGEFDQRGRKIHTISPSFPGRGEVGLIGTSSYPQHWDKCIRDAY